MSFESTKLSSQSLVQGDPKVSSTAELWGPLFARLDCMREPAGPGRTVEDLEDQRGTCTCQYLYKILPEGLLLRDGKEYWTHESLWVRGQTLGRSYSLRFQGEEYEFSRVTDRRDPHAKESGDSREARISKRASLVGARKQEAA